MYYGTSEHQVMFCHLLIAPSTLIKFNNNIFHAKLDLSDRIYLNDLVI